MKIIKRNGSEATFDSEKIVAAITKANNSEEGTRLSPEQIHDIADYVEYKCNKIGRAVSVEEVQDMVENQIMATGAFDLAKHYVQYRYQRSFDPQIQHHGYPDPFADRMQQRRGQTGKFQQKPYGQQRTA